MVENNKRRNFIKGSAMLGGIAVATMAFADGKKGNARRDVEKNILSEDAISKLPRVKQKLVAPPAVPQHEQVASGGPKIIEVEMSIAEKKIIVDDEGTEMWAMMYEDSMPGPLIVCHEGDYVELTLINPEENTFEHNIDFHASTGALGGAALTHVSPGEKTVLRWKAIKPGVHVYHCAPGGTMVPWHVVCGMSGAVMVLPRKGLTDDVGNKVNYDKVAYIGEHDLYLPTDKNGKYKKYDSLADTYEDTLKAMRTLTPSHIVFNGRVGSMVGETAIKGKVGETWLIIHASANRDTRPHLIGGHGDLVWETGSFTTPPQTGLETWFVRGGSAGVALYTFRQPGVYAYLNHNLIEAFLFGAACHFKIEGKWNNELMKQIVAPTDI